MDKKSLKQIAQAVSNLLEPRIEKILDTKLAIIDDQLVRVTCDVAILKEDMDVVKSDVSAISEVNEKLTAQDTRMTHFFYLLGDAKADIIGHEKE